MQLSDFFLNHFFDFIIFAYYFSHVRSKQRGTELNFEID